MSIVHLCARQAVDCGGAGATTGLVVVAEAEAAHNSRAKLSRWRMAGLESQGNTGIRKGNAKPSTEDYAVDGDADAR